MKLGFIILISALVLIACGPRTSPDTGVYVTAYDTQSPMGEPLAGQTGKVTEAVVKVEKVDMENRILTVKDEQGTITSIKVAPEIKRLPEIKKGDLIVVQIIQAIVYELRPSTPEERLTPVAAVTTGERRDKMLPPGAGVANAVRKLVTIQSIDRQANTVTIKGPAGETAVLAIHRPENFERVKVGDTVVVTYVEAVAISVEPKK